MIQYSLSRSGFAKNKAELCVQMGQWLYTLEEEGGYFHFIPQGCSQEFTLEKKGGVIVMEFCGEEYSFKLSHGTRTTELILEKVGDLLSPHILLSQF